MAAISISYAVSATGCAGGHHFGLTATLRGLGADRVVELEIPDINEQPTDDALKECLGTLTWILFKKYLADVTHAEAKTLIDTKQIVLDPQASP